MAGVVADSVDKRTGRPTKFVLAMQRPSARSYWKIPYLQQGIPPVQSEDPEVEVIVRRGVLEKKTLSATFSYDALELADVVVVDVQCDYVKDKLGDMRVGRADIAALEESFAIIGERIRPECLVLIETTVPPGPASASPFRSSRRRSPRAACRPIRWWPTPTSGSCPAETMLPPCAISGESAAASPRRPVNAWCASSPRS